MLRNEWRAWIQLFKSGVLRGNRPGGRRKPGLRLRVESLEQRYAPTANVTNLTPATDTGASDHDAITSNTTPTLVGTAKPGDTVTVSIDGTPLTDTATADGSGNWTFDLSATVPATVLGEGVRDISAADSEGVGDHLPVTIDTISPVVTLTSPTDGSSTNVDAPTFSGTAGTADGDSSTITVKIFEGTGTTGTLVQTLTTTAAAGAWSVDASPALAQGTYTAQAEQADTAGNPGTSDPATFTVDTTLPAVTLTSPADGSSTNDTTPTFSGTAGTADGDSSTVTVKIYEGTDTSGTLVQTLTTTAAAGDWSVDATTMLAEGTYTAQAEQADSAGNTGLSDPHSFTVDITEPVVTLDSPTNLSSTTDTTPTISGTAGTEAGDSSTITVKIYEGPTTSGTLVQTLTTTATAGTWSVDAASLAQGGYTAQAEQADSAGNIGLSDPVIFFVIDNDAPVVTLTSPADGSSTNDTTPTFSGTAGTEAGDSSTVTVKIYEGTDTSGTLVQTLTTTAAAGDWSVDATTMLAEGTYTAQAEQTDSAFNTGFSSANTFTVDITAPVVTLDSPTDGSMVNDTTPTFSGTAGTAEGDSSTITVKIYEGTDTSGTLVQTLTTTAAAGAWSVDASPALAQGTYTAQAEQADNAGNVGLSSTVTFDVIDNDAPVVTLTSPANGSSINDATPTFSGTAGTEAGDSSPITVKIYEGTDTSGTLVQTLTTTAAAGAWSVDAMTTLADGTYTAQAEQADSAGNIGHSSANTFTVDATAPVVTLTSPANGSSTTDTTPTFSGTAGTAAGDSSTITVKIFLGTDTTGTLVQTLTTTAAAGTWSVDASPALAQGTYTARAEQADSTGNIGFSSANTFTVDTTAPVVTLTSPANGSLINDATPTLSGAAGTLDGDSSTITVKIYQGSNTSGTLLQTLTTTATAGAWSVDAATLAQGTYTAQAEQADAAGNIGHSSANTFTVDATAPVVTLTSPANGSTTNDATPTFNGTAGINAGDSTTVTVKIYSGSTATGTPVQTLTATASSGLWSVTATTALADGTFTAQAEQADSAGNTGLSSANTFTVDATTPAAPQGLTLAAATDSGVLGDNRTNFTQPTLTGTAEAGSTVKLFDGATQVGSATATGSGAWSITASTLSEGAHTLTAKASDTAGNTSSSSTPLTVTIDTTPPAVPSVPALTTASDTGISHTDNITTLATPTFTGAAEAGSTVRVFDGSVLLGTATANSTGVWTFTSPTLANGPHSISATATDAAGNTSPASAARSVTIDTTGRLANPLHNVTNQVRITRTKPRHVRNPRVNGNPVRGRGPFFRQTVTITNTSGSTIDGPLFLVLNGLPSGVNLLGRSGRTQVQSPRRSQFLMLDVSSLAAGQSVSVVLTFANPLLRPITYSPRLLAGVGTL
jgi:large repetitive protein